MAAETTIEQPSRAATTRTEETHSARCYRPNVDILETPDELTLLVDIPGAHADDIDLNFENGTLTIHGRVPPRQREARFLRREYGVGDFSRSFQINEQIDASKIKAEFVDGVLTLHLPKAEAAKPRRIRVNAKS